jgi:hypothetical protein
MLSVHGCLLSLENGSARYAAWSALNPGGTKPALSTPMSPLCGRADTTSVTTEPSSPNPARSRLPARWSPRGCGP